MTLKFRRLQKNEWKSIVGAVGATLISCYRLLRDIGQLIARWLLEVAQHFYALYLLHLLQHYVLT